MAIFQAGALLQKNLAGIVKKEDVHRAVEQVIPMHRGPRARRR